MGLDALKTTDVIEVMEGYLERVRPPVEMRSKIDISYRIDNQSIFIYEIRPRPDGSGDIMHNDVAKTTFVKNNNQWKIFWKRASLKWDPYEPEPIVKTLQEFITTVENDSYGCFWG